MKMLRASGAGIVAGALLAVAAGPADDALIQRTFVASTGIDSNPCTLAAPCRSFGAAILQALDGGEILVKDSAGYGPVTIGKSVSIVAPDGIYAGVSVPAGADGIVIDGPGVTVDLRGLSVNGAAGSRYGIWMKTGAALELDNVKVSGMQVGLYAQAPDAATLVQRSLFTRNSSLGLWFSNSYNVVRNTVAQRNGSGGGVDGGIRADGYGELHLDRSEATQNYGNGVTLDDGTAVGTMRVAIDESRFYGNIGHGIHARSNDQPHPTLVEITRSTSASNGGNGVHVEVYGGGTPHGFAHVTVTDCTISGNKGLGVQVAGGGFAVALLSHNTITTNLSWGIDGGALPSDIIYSRGDNMTAYNRYNTGAQQTTGNPLQAVPSY